MLRSRAAAGILALTVGTVAVAVAIQPIFQEPEMPMPGDQHQMLLTGVGNYAGTITMEAAFMPPGAPTDPVPCTDKVEAVGGFWTTGTFECQFMGMPFIGRSSMGYDPAKKKFVGTWIDSMTPSLSVMEGDYDEDKKALVMNWEAPGMTGAMVKHRSETIHTEAGYHMSFFQELDGELKPSMQIRMKRVREGAVEAGSDK